MVRNPATVQADDTMEHCLLLGRQLGVAQFPVLDGEALVGVISANEIFQLAAHCLGNWQQGAGGADGAPARRRRATPAPPDRTTRWRCSRCAR